MITINLKQKLHTLEGKEVTLNGQEACVGTFLAQLVLEPRKVKKGFRPLQAWELAQKLHAQETIELDTSIVIQIEEILEDTEAVLPFVVAQLQEIIIKAKTETK